VKDVLAMIGGARSVLVVGCRSCAAICMAGGEREAETLAEAIRLKAAMDGSDVGVRTSMAERQCEREFLIPLSSSISESDVVVSLGCGVGVQVIQEMFPSIRAVPGLDTSNMGSPEERGVFLERCGGGGGCVLHLTGGVCPVARCSKSLMNGPCGGSQDGRCEVGDNPCAWQLIHDSLMRLGRADLLTSAIPPRDWRRSRSGGPRRVVVEAAAESDEERAARGRTA